MGKFALALLEKQRSLFLGQPARELPNRKISNRWGAGKAGKKNLIPRLDGRNLIIYFLSFLN
jgi:hypothetical protein